MDFKNFSLNIAQTKVNRFVDELAAGKFMATVCKKCGKKYYPPLADCSNCMQSDMEWKQISHQGTLVTFTKIHVPPDHFAVRQPLMPFSSIQFEPCPIGTFRGRRWIEDHGLDTKGGCEKDQGGDEDEGLALYSA